MVSLVHTSSGRKWKMWCENWRTLFRISCSVEFLRSESAAQTLVCLVHQVNLSIPSVTVIFINCIDYHTYQLRAYIYQARDMYGSDKSGLSDPYAIVSFNRYSVNTRVVKESVCPTWDQTILIHQIKIFGEPSTVRDSAPPVIVQFYDKDTVVGPQHTSGSTVVIVTHFYTLLYMYCIYCTCTVFPQIVFAELFVQTCYRCDC